MRLDAHQWLLWPGYAFALASMAYSLLCAFATRSRMPAGPGRGGPMPPITVLKPLCGAEPETYECLRSFCEQHYAEYQVVFGVCEADDAAIPVVRRLQREFPQLELILAVERRQHGSNPKVGNLINMMAHARHDLLIVSDSDVKVGAEYLARLAPALQDAGVGLVTCGYRGVARAGIWSLLGAMYINEWFMPSVKVAALLGYRSCAFGATLGLRRETLAKIGGFQSIADQLADDYRLGELIRARGLKTVLSDLEVDTVVGERSAADLITHELRWRRTIRNLSPYGHGFSFITLGVPVTALQWLFAQGAAPAAAIFGVTALAAVAIHLRARAPGASPLRLLLVPLRDALHLSLWIWSFASRRVQWRNDRYRLSRDGAAQPLEGLGR
ncbi:MAG TPA: bacteriohopanetetrol glucosamine biosynthesis glycosyltransferase HpnI [Steroidobacteraceae bacterium]|nr:bacteriohopanetetrol glucosamine biosynthesis glycosyltransferase HpnI [Steroidobacteraceae bacterium]